MKLVMWSFKNLSVPMMEDDSGELYCTSKAVCKSLDIKEDAIKKVYGRHKDEFDEICVTNCHPIDDVAGFLKQHKERFGIRYVRGNMRLWTVDDMLTFAILSKSAVSKEFRKAIRQFIKEHALVGYISKEEFEAQMQEYNTRAIAQGAQIDLLTKMIMETQEAVRGQASRDSSNLRWHKNTKAIRNSNVVDMAEYRQEMMQCLA